MSIINSQPRIGAAGQSTGFKIERSLRFNSADSAYLNRTPASAGNRRTWTWSAWVKLGNVGNWGGLFNAGTSGDQFAIYLFTDSTLYIQDYASSANNIVIQPTQVFRDPSAWYHIVVAIDTTQATSSNRVKVYINGSQVTAFSTSTYPSQNYDTQINSTSFAHNVGRNFQFATSTAKYFDGYLTEINFIDGSAKTPSDFGENDTDTGVWKPKAYSGTYGTNGFYLKFADNSGTTSTTLGKDSSGNGNNWTPNNFYVGPGTTNAEKAGIDSLVDTPTPYGTDTGAGGEVRGNYCTWNPLDKNSSYTLTNGNLNAGSAAANWIGTRATFGISSGKWYWEILVNGSTASKYTMVGIMKSSDSLSTYVGGSGNTSGYAYNAFNGQKYNNGVANNYGSTYTAGDVIGVALDMDAGTIVFYKNGVSQGTAYSSLSGTFFPAVSAYADSGTSDVDANFGQRPFAYTAPSGFKALCTQNLPTPTIGATATTRADDYFNTVLWSGDSTGTTRSISGVGFQPDFVWIKARNQPYRHTIYDAVRGAAADKYLSSSTTDAEGTSNYAGLYGYVSAFQSDGFQLTKGTDPSDQYAWINQTGTTYVGWNWKANGAGSSNTSGTITSTVSANTTAGFSVVTYTGNGTSGATVGHGCLVNGAATTPSMVIVKKRSAAANWFVKHASVPGTQQLLLNDTIAATNAGSFTNGGVGNLASTTFGFLIGTSDVNNCNENGATFVAYCFAPVAGYSAFGSYVANGSTDGNFIYTDMAPRFVLIKCSSTSENWVIFDTARDTYNVAGKLLRPNLSDAELDSPPRIDILSNGFKIRASGTALPNTSGATYIYMALAANPFKYSLAR